MTIIRILCRDCERPLHIKNLELEILLCTTDESLSTLAYRCPQCGPQLRSLSGAEISLLTAGDVPVRRWAVEWEPINLDDIIEFHEHLDEELDAILGDS